MNRLLIGAALALGLGTASAAFALDPGYVLGTDEASVRQSLEAQGFEVRKIEAEDRDEADGGEALEVYAVKDGQRFEIYVDRATGVVQEISRDD